MYPLLALWAPPLHLEQFLRLLEVIELVTAGRRGSPIVLRVAPAITWEERLTIASEIGRFLARAAGEGHRGSSGRERIPLASRYWVVVRGFSGVTFDPARVFSKWSLAKSFVKQGSECGDSVFVGLPSQREVERALSAGGFRWGGKVEA